MKFKQAVFGLALTLAAGAAAGGAYLPFPLTIDFENRFAAGDMYSVRLFDSEGSLIGCGVRAIAPGFSYAFCQARLGPTDDQLVNCFTDDPAYVATVQAMDDFSYVQFSWDDDGNCTQVGNSTQSLYLPEFFKTGKSK